MVQDGIEVGSMKNRIIEPELWLILLMSWKKAWIHFSLYSYKTESTIFLVEIVYVHFLLMLWRKAWIHFSLHSLPLPAMLTIIIVLADKEDRSVSMWRNYSLMSTLHTDVWATMLWPLLSTLKYKSIANMPRAFLIFKLLNSCFISIRFSF